MALHARTLIRQRAAAALVGKTAAGVRVGTERVAPDRLHELPSIAVYFEEESAEEENESPREYIRTARMLVDAAVKLEPAAAQAAGPATATGADGSAIAAGLILRRTSDGMPYTVDAAATIAGGVAALALTAVLAGADTDAAAGVTLTFDSPPAGVNATVTVVAPGLTGGADGVDSRMDAIAKEIEAVFTSDRYLGDQAAKKHLAYDTRYTGAEFSLSHDGPVPMGVVQLTYEVEYLTKEVADISTLQPLTQAGTQIHVTRDDTPANHSHDNDDAGDELVLEGGTP